MERIRVNPLPILALLAVLLLGPGLTPDALAEPRSDTSAGKESTILRVGVYESRAVALAYGRSELNMERIRDLKGKFKQAEAEGDEVTKTECETLGPRWQDLLHRQVFGDAPIRDILAILEPHLPELRKTTGVELIVTGVVTAGDGVEVVDVTREMMTLFDVDEETIEMAGQIKNSPPVPWYEFPLEGE